MIIDSGFQSSPSGKWVGGPPPGNPDIGPAAPTTPYAPMVLPNGAYLSAIESTPKANTYPTVESYFTRPVLLPTGTKLFLDFDAWVDAGISGANAFETDTMLVTAGSTPATNVRRNFSIQNVKGQLYLVLSNAWVPIPGAICPLAAGQKYHHSFSYAFGSSSGAILSIAINGVTWEVPAAMQKADIAELAWTPCAMMQLQQSLLPTGTGYQTIIDTATYTWLP
jgi:hypothetical protein